MEHLEGNSHIKFPMPRLRVALERYSPLQLIKQKETGSHLGKEPADSMVETGESRTLLSINQAISKDTPYVPYLSTNSVLESSLQQVWEPTKLQSDPTKLLPQLLDQLIVQGQTAQQLRHALGSNGYRPEKISEVFQQLTEGGDYAH